MHWITAFIRAGFCLMSSDWQSLSKEAAPAKAASISIPLTAARQESHGGKYGKPPPHTLWYIESDIVVFAGNSPQRPVHRVGGGYEVFSITVPKFFSQEVSDDKELRHRFYSGSGLGDDVEHRLFEVNQPEQSVKDVRVYGVYYVNPGTPFPNRQR